MNKPLILVVEDDAPVRNLITTTLKLHDYRFLTAANGDTALIEASSHNPDIILLDLGLPDRDYPADPHLEHDPHYRHQRPQRRYRQD